MLKRWKVKSRLEFNICGYTIQQAVQENIRRLAYSSRIDNECILSIDDFSIDWSDEILGGSGGVKVIIDCSVSTAYTTNSSDYYEFHQVYEARIFAKKSDLNPPAKDES